MPTNSDIASLRLYNQRIAAARFTRPEEVVRWMGAMQAQDYQQALWAIGARMQHGVIADVEQAVASGTILRTWPMRGTIHFVPAEDARWMLKLSAPRMIAKDARRLEQLDLDETIMQRCKEIFHDALKGGRRLTRSEMTTLLEDEGIAAGSQRGYHILWYTSQTGDICIGPMQDKQQTFALLDEWAPDSRVLSRADALAELASRYFTSHGPATVHDFAWWAGLPVADARAGLAAARPALSSFTSDGKEYWATADAPGDQELDEAYLLPGFDEYLLGYKDRSAVLPIEYAPRIVPGGNGVFQPTIVVAGQVVGTWKRKLTKRSLSITLTPFTPLGESEGRAAAAAGRYSAFIGPPSSATVIEPSGFQG